MEHAAARQPWMTPEPTVKSNGAPRSRLLSKRAPPSVSVPT